MLVEDAFSNHMQVWWNGGCKTQSNFIAVRRNADLRSAPPVQSCGDI